MSSVDPETKALQDAIYVSKVKRAREMTEGERMAVGARLFDEGMRMMRSAIRADNPAFTEEQVEAEVDRRLRIRRAIDEGNIYRDAGIYNE